jgi:hypothetical protein
MVEEKVVPKLHEASSWHQLVVLGLLVKCSPPTVSLEGEQNIKICKEQRSPPFFSKR